MEKVLRLVGDQISFSEVDEKKLLEYVNKIPIWVLLI